MEQTYLPGKVRDRIRDLMKEQKLTQADLAYRIGGSESTISRFLSEKTDKLGDENIIRIARVFNVSTDFLLGETDEPDRKNYEISELGLSVQAAKNLYTGKVNKTVVNYLLENPGFAETTQRISRLINGSLAAGFAAQNQLYASISAAMVGDKNARKDIKSLQTPIFQADLSAIQNSFMKVIREIKEEAAEEASFMISNSKGLTKEVVERIVAELPRDGDAPVPHITRDELSNAVAVSVSHLDVNTELVKQAMSAIIESVSDTNADE